MTEDTVGARETLARRVASVFGQVTHTLTFLHVRSRRVSPAAQRFGGLVNANTSVTDSRLQQKRGLPKECGLSCIAARDSALLTLRLRSCEFSIFQDEDKGNGPSFPSAGPKASVRAGARRFTFCLC